MQLGPGHQPASKYMGPDVAWSRWNWKLKYAPANEEKKQFMQRGHVKDNSCDIFITSSEKRDKPHHHDSGGADERDDSSLENLKMHDELLKLFLLSFQKCVFVFPN